MVDDFCLCVVGSGGQTGYVHLSTVLVHRLHKQIEIKQPGIVPEIGVTILEPICQNDVMSRIASISTNRLEDRYILQTEKKSRSNNRV
jgi:hypothetical protein